MYKNKINYKLLNFLILMGLLYICVTNIGTWFQIISKVVSVCFPFIIAFAIAYALYPLEKKLEKKGVRKSIAITFLVIISLLIIFGLIAITLPLVYQQLISFASSFGVSQIPWYQKKATARYLSRIDYVSCRENRGAEIVKELTGREVPVLMDPVFAFDKKEWANIVHEEKVYNEPYIFCYLLGSNLSHREAVKKFAQEKGLKVVFLKYLDQYVDYDADFGDITPFDVDPDRFLNILRGAEYVFTDSFHGCAFSIIMKKEFVVFNRYSATSGASKNSRIDTVLSNLGLESRRADANHLSLALNKPINWTYVDIELAKYKHQFRNYLSTSLS